MEEKETFPSGLIDHPVEGDPKTNDYSFSTPLRFRHFEDLEGSLDGLFCMFASWTHSKQMKIKAQ